MTNNTNLLLAEKDKLIDELKLQITTQTQQIEELTKNVQQLSQNIAEMLKAKNTTTLTNVNTTTTTPCRKRQLNGTTDFRASKAHENAAGPSKGGINQSTLDSYFAEQNINTNPDDMDTEISESETTSEHQKHNLTTGTKDTNDNAVSWSDVMNFGGNASTKPTPIQIGSVPNDDYTSILSAIRLEFGITGYEWLQLRKNVSPRIICQNDDIKVNIMKFLVENNIEYNTFADKHTKRKAFIVRGLIHGNDEDNIKFIGDSMAEYHIDGVCSITRFETPTMKRNEGSTPLYQLVLTAQTDDTRLAQIKTIDTFRVKFEKMLNSKVVQCRRCQRYSHTAASCAFKYRCVQCLHSRGPGNCPRQTNKKLPIGCINCSAYGISPTNHTGNDLKNCGYFNKIKNQRGVTYPRHQIGYKQRQTKQTAF